MTVCAGLSYIMFELSYRLRSSDDNFFFLADMFSVDCFLAPPIGVLFLSPY